MHTLIQDLRYGWRMLAKNPGFTSIAVLTLAVGIGASTAMFSIVNAVLLRPLGFSDPARLMMIWERDKVDPISNTSYATFLDWKALNHSFEHIAVSSSWLPIMNGENDSERLHGLRVSADFFKVLQAQPQYGRDFLSEEDVRGSNHVVILSHGLWQRRFGGDPGLVGKSILMDGIDYRVVGILPANFENVFSSDNEPAVIWSPLAYNPGLSWACRTCRHLQAAGRLKPGVTIDQAAAEMDVISRSLTSEHPNDYSATGVVLQPLHEKVVGKSRPVLYTLLGAVLLVLLIACMNVASLLLNRATHRKREMAIRAALGATSQRLIRQLATEGFLLCVLGGGFGVLLAVWMLGVLRAAGAANLPRLETVSVDYRVLGFASVLSLLSGFVFALAPIFHATRVDVNDGVKEGGRLSSGARHQRLRATFVVANVALALVLLLGAGLLLRSLGRLLGTDPGFESANVLTANMDVSGQRYKKDDQVFAFYEQALKKLKSVPGIETAAVTSQLPLGGNVDGYGVHPEGRLSPNPEMDPSADRYGISPDYLRVMHIPVLRGRAFSEADRSGSPMVVLVNQTLANRIWPNEDAIGKRVKVGGIDGEWRTIVGVVGDVLHASLDAPHTMQVYVPQSQWFAESGMVLVLRTTSGSSSMVGAVRNAIAQVDKNQPVFKFANMDQVMTQSVGQRRFTVFLLALFATTALFLAALGIYGVVSYFVSMRRQEIGIRMALGATPRLVLRLVLSYGMKLAVAGIVMGLAAGLAFSHVLTSMLYHTSAIDPVAVGGVCLLLASMVALATYVPAYRATQCDPSIVLRHE